MFISIGIPFFNAEKYILDAVRSVFNQTHQDWELILMDDGSTDRSLELVSSIRDPRVRVVSDGKNMGLPFRLNQICNEAKYDYLGRMDADDLMASNRFERQLRVLSSDSSIDLVTSGVCSISNDNAPVGVRVARNSPSITGENLILGRCPVVHAAILGRRAWFLRNRYNETLKRTEDYELWIRSFLRNDFRISILPEPLYFYREEDTVTLEKLLSAYSSQRGLYKAHGENFLNKTQLLALQLKSLAKSLAVRVLNGTVGLEFLVARRNETIDKGMLLGFESEIDAILRLRLPGV